MNQFFERRLSIMMIFISITIVLLLRLFYLQIIDNRYLIDANNNVIRTLITYPARGVILDRNDKVLADNQPVYDIMVTPSQVKPFDSLMLAKLIGIDLAEIKARLGKAVKVSPTQPTSFAKQVSAMRFARLQEMMSEFPGFYVQPHYLRTYPDSVAAQFLGFIGEVNETDIRKSNGYFKPGDYIGRTGVEKAYEQVLQGRRGIQKILVDSRNRPKGRFANGEYDTTALAGQRLVSSLDLRLQKLGEKLMQNKVGSIVAIEPETGEVLCFVSSPT